MKPLSRLASASVTRSQRLVKTTVSLAAAGKRQAKTTRPSWRGKFEVSTITCNEGMKGNAKCKNSRFEPPFGGLQGNAQGSSSSSAEFLGLTSFWWKAHCRLPISDKWTFSLAFTAETLLSEIFLNRRFLKGWVTLSANCRYIMGTLLVIRLWTVRYGYVVAITLSLEVFTQRNFVADFFRQKLNFTGKK